MTREGMDLLSHTKLSSLIPFQSLLSVHPSNPCWTEGALEQELEVDKVSCSQHYTQKKLPGSENTSENGVVTHRSQLSL